MRHCRSHRPCRLLQGHPSGSVSSTSGAFGSVPLAGTITWAESPGAAPTWIFPVTPSPDLSVYTAVFQFQMWRLLYWFGNGVSPTVVPSMSLAYPATYSNDDTTATVHLKTNYRWSDGPPVTAKDALFDIDMVRTAVKESGANWGYYSPHIGIPDQLVSASTPNATTLVIHLNKPVNPAWFTDDELYYINPIPVHAWAKASANGPVLDFTNPANAKRSTTSWPSNPAPPASTRATRCGRSWMARTG
jgi:peptide/nickel transport system substrate-binding protein